MEKEVYVIKYSDTTDSEVLQIALDGKQVFKSPENAQKKIDILQKEADDGLIYKGFHPNCSYYQNIYQRGVNLHNKLAGAKIVKVLITAAVASD